MNVANADENVLPEPSGRGGVGRRCMNLKAIAHDKVNELWQEL
jgi:hypothetical protein